MGLNQENYHTLPLGKELKDKIQIASEFIRERPQFFTKDSGLSLPSTLSSITNRSVSESEVENRNHHLNRPVDIVTNREFSNRSTNSNFELESPDIHLTQANDLLDPTFGCNINCNPADDYVAFYPPRHESDSANSSDEDSTSSPRDYRSRLFDINFDISV